MQRKFNLGENQNSNLNDQLNIQMQKIKVSVSELQKSKVYNNEVERMRFLFELIKEQIEQVSNENSCHTAR